MPVSKAMHHTNNHMRCNNVSNRYGNNNESYNVDDDDNVESLSRGVFSEKESRTIVPLSHRHVFNGRIKPTNDAHILYAFVFI